MRTVVAILAACAASSVVHAWTNPCGADPYKSMPFCDPSQSTDARAKDLVSRLQESELPGLFVNGASSAKSVNFPGYQWWSEALHGVAHSPGVKFGGDLPAATSFPQVCTTAAAFNKTLIQTIGSSISTELRAFNNKDQSGLTAWTPNINVFVKPRWGRGQETPGEDPTANGIYAANFVSSFQAVGSEKVVKASACLKHWDAYNLEDWDGVDRHHYDGNVTQQDLADTYQPAFEAGVREGKATSVMCSYQATNGVPSCANGDWNNKVLRQSWGFSGYLTSDCGAVSDVQNTHHYTSNPDDTIKATLVNGGMDIDCGSYVKNNLAAAFKDGSVKVSDVTTPLEHQFGVLIDLGLFDDAASQPYRQITPAAVNTPEHQALALDAAEQGMTLLKNADSQGLPFGSSIKSIALIGPNANATNTLQGNYYGTAPYLVSPYEGFGKLTTVHYEPGCDITGGSTAGFNAAAGAAKIADAVVLVMGLDQSQEREGHDRDILTLPGVQQQLIETVAAAAAGKPVVVVLLGGGMVDMTFAKNSDAITAIMWAGYPGQSGGDAIARTVFGLNVPAGRLAQTMYPGSYNETVSMFNQNVRPDPSKGYPGRSYRFYTGEAVYPFGYGLSYTTFKYSWSQEAEQAGEIRASSSALKAFAANYPTWQEAAPLRGDLPALASASVTVTNTGSVDAADSVLLFVTPPNAGKDGNPLKYLVDYTKIFLKAGESQTVNFSLTSRDLALFGQDGRRYAPEGLGSVVVGVGANEERIPLVYA